MAEPGDVTLLLEELRRGDAKALDRLIPIVHQELQRLARHYFRQNPNSALQPTAVVNEAYLRLSQQAGKGWQNREHFFGVAAQVMRNILVDYARARRAQKRGGMQVRVELDEGVAGRDAKVEELLALDESLRRLSELDPRAGRVVELRYFGGLEIEEIAVLIGVSEKTVKREWTFARTWLSSRLAP